MRLRPPKYALRWCLLFIVPFVLAQDDFDCKPTIGKLKYDLTALAGEHVISRTRETPPSTMLDELRFNLCADLTMKDGVKEGDQCPAGTRACLTKTNKKVDETDRIVAVIPIAQTSSFKPELAVISSPKGLTVIMHGGEYPSPANPIKQSLHVTLLCAPGESGEPVLKGYEAGQVKVEWSAQGACGFEDPEGGDGSDGGGEKKEERVGSGLGWFFLVLLLAFAAYFALGAYYNYSTYGATGADLIPHRDFWKEVPYMLKDVLAHLCSTVRPRHHSTKGGYIAV